MAAVHGEATATMVASDSASSVFQSIAGLRNVKALVAALGCGLAAVLLAGLIGVLFARAGAADAGAALALLVFLTLFFTGINAQGLLLMDQAQGLQPRRMVDAIVYGLFCIPKEIAIFIGLVLAIIVAVVLVVVVLYLTMIPGVGPLLFTIVFPLSVIFLGATLFGAWMSVSLMFPALWSGARLAQAFAQLMAIIKSRLVEGLTLLGIAWLLSFVLVGSIVGLVLLSGFFTTTLLSVGIVGAGGGDISSMIGGFGGFGGGFPGGSRMRGGGVEGYAIAGLIGTALLWVTAIVAVVQVFHMGTSIIYLKLTEGLDVSAAEAALASRAKDAWKGAAALGDRAKQAAERAKEQAEAAARVASANMAARRQAEQAAMPQASTAMSQRKCEKCGQPMLVTDKFCGHCGAPGAAK